MKSLKGIIYRTVMRIAHKYNWHYAPPIYHDGDTQLWCKWCGFRETIKRNDRKYLGELYGVRINIDKTLKPNTYRITGGTR